jgi:adenine-specific DNA methylase
MKIYKKSKDILNLQWCKTNVQNNDINNQTTLIKGKITYLYKYYNQSNYNDNLDMFLFVLTMF